MQVQINCINIILIYYLPLNHNGSLSVALVLHIQMYQRLWYVGNLKKINKYEHNGNFSWPDQWLPLPVIWNSAAVWKQVLKSSITTARRVGAFVCIHYYITAGQTKVPNPNVAVMTMEENVSWLWKKTLQ